MSRILIAIFCFLIACNQNGKSSDPASSSAQCGPKSVFSFWVDDSGDSINLTGFQFGQAGDQLIELAGVTCSLTATAIGDECSGKISVSAATLIAPIGALTTICSDWVGEYDYKRFQSGMTFAKSGSTPLLFQ